MKRDQLSFNRIRTLLVVLGMIVTFWGCSLFEKGEDEPDNNTGIITEEEVQQLDVDYNTICATANELILADNRDVDRIRELVEEYRNLESVDDAWMEESGDIVVRFKKAGVFIWQFSQPESIPPSYINMDDYEEEEYEDEPEITLFSKKSAVINDNYPKKKKVLIINAVHNEMSFVEPIVSALRRNMNNSDYPGTGGGKYSCPTIFTDGSLDINFLKTRLNEYGVICLVAHGGTYEGHVYVVARKEEKNIITRIGNTLLNIKDITPEVINITPEDLEDESIIVGHYKNILGTIVTTYGITEKFYEKYYEADNNALFYTGQCQGMKDGVLAKVLLSKGVGCVIGYDETNNQGHWVIKNLFEGLLGGNTVEDTFEEVIPEHQLTNRFTDKDGISHVANLRYYYPEGKSDFKLVNKGQDSIEFYYSDGSPRPVESVETYRRITLKGKLIGFENAEDIEARIEVSALGGSPEPTRVEINNDQTFSLNHDIFSGSNKILMVASGRDKETGSRIIASNEITITGEFPPVSLWTKLSWNTKNDVDLHLTGPDGIDCYYQRKTVSSWGGSLDVDYLNGEGPEHITIPELKKMGRYTLWVHYYNDKGKGASSVAVYVEGGNQRSSYNARLNATGDKWTVCYIDFTEEYPEGKIVPTGALKNSVLPITDLPAKETE